MNRLTVIEKLQREIASRLAVLSIFMGTKDSWIAESYVKEKVMDTKYNLIPSLDFENQARFNEMIAKMDEKIIQFGISILGVKH